MRTIIMMVAMLFATVCSADAQKVMSRSRIKIKKERPKCEWSLKAGLMMNSLSCYTGYEGIGDISTGFTPGFDLSLGFLRPFKVGGNAYWGFQLGIGTRGGAASDGSGTDSDYGSDYNYRYEFTWNTEKTTYYAPHIGPLIGYSFKLGDKNKLNVHLAVEYSHLLEESSYKVTDEGTAYIYEHNVNGNEEYSTERWSGSREFWLSGPCIEPELGIDYYFDKWFISAAYKHGFIIDGDGQNKNIFIGLGYQF